MKNARFKKGQTIYRAGLWSETRMDQTGKSMFVFVVFESVVDACGKKRVTFYDNDLQPIHHSDRPDNKNLCETPEMAFARCRELVAETMERCERMTREAVETGYKWFATANQSVFHVHPVINMDGHEGYKKLKEQLVESGLTKLAIEGR